MILHPHSRLANYCSLKANGQEDYSYLKGLYKDGEKKRDGFFKYCNILKTKEVKYQPWIFLE